MILVIDNYDSFTWNLVHLIEAAAGRVRPGAIRVVRNDRITVRQALALDPTHVLISPGPCGPARAGVSLDLVREFAGRVPVLGVCLGHQCIAAAFGMRVEPLTRPVHGLASPVHHDGRGVFRGLPNPLPAARYHSLVVPRDAVPDGWSVSAWTDSPGESVVMGLRRAWSGAPLEGVQFHPESFLTEHGTAMMSRFLGDTVAP